MRIIQTLTEQHPEISLRTNGRMMQSMEAYEATISCKEEVGVRTSQMRDGVESCTIHSDKDRRGEMRLREEFDPMYIVVIEHVH
jgi:hypothetical protein